MWAWVTNKFAGIAAFIGVAIVIIVSLLKQGEQKEELRQEKEKAKDQQKKNENQIEVIKAAQSVKNKNALVSDSTIINRLRFKWQRD